MDSPQSVQQIEVRVRGQAARVFSGGAGEALLLVHGGWGGARFHWRRVWDLLAQRHRVIAPDLPGLGAVEQPACGSVREYVEWLVALLDALRVERAWCVGNSFGASVVWSLAGREPRRCAGLALVNGIPMPRTPPLLATLGRNRVARALMRALVSRWSYRRSAVPLAFARLHRVPEELERLIEEEWPIILPRFTALLMAGDGPPNPPHLPLLLWGSEDRLLGTRRKDALRLAASLHGSKLRWVEAAGHFPELEAPEAFVAELEDFMTGGQHGGSSRPPGNPGVL
jgi:2-hydroxy-6-oxonona-2,4-dienedioate hydrolase